MTLVAIFVTAWTNPPIQWLMVGIAAVTTILTYTGKNLLPWFKFLHSDSPAGTLSLINILSGLFLALGAGLLDGLGQYFIEGVIVWAVLWKVVASITLTYIVATWFAPPYTTKKVAMFGNPLKRAA
jgi:phage shock protein PspC (stress-responsive transcriptional regulator)